MNSDGEEYRTNASPLRALVYFGDGFDHIVDNYQEALEQTSSLYIVREACLVCFMESFISFEPYLAEKERIVKKLRTTNPISVNNVFFKSSCKNKHHDDVNATSWIEFLQELGRFTDVFVSQGEESFFPYPHPENVRPHHLERLAFALQSLQDKLRGFIPEEPQEVDTENKTTQLLGEPIAESQIPVVQGPIIHSTKSLSFKNETIEVRDVHSSIKLQRSRTVKRSEQQKSVEKPSTHVQVARELKEAQRSKPREVKTYERNYRHYDVWKRKKGSNSPKWKAAGHGVYRKESI